MPNIIDFIDVEIYTEKLNDMYARIAEFISAYPKNQMVEQLKSQQHILAVAHHQSRFHCDEQHLSKWDALLRQSEKMIMEARIANVLK